MLARRTLGLIRRSSYGFPAFARSSIIRSLNTVQTTHDRNQEILVAQRKNRPQSPDLAIYQPQVTWILSGFHRVSGVLLGFSFYGLTTAYVLSSIMGFQFDSNVIAESFHSLSTASQAAIKAIPVSLFFFHLSNGFRHLIWDSGKELTLKGVYRTGYAVIAFTSVVGLYYTLF